MTQGRDLQWVLPWKNCTNAAFPLFGDPDNSWRVPGTSVFTLVSPLKRDVTQCQGTRSRPPGPRTKFTIYCMHNIRLVR